MGRVAICGVIDGGPEPLDRPVYYGLEASVLAEEALLGEVALSEDADDTAASSGGEASVSGLASRLAAATEPVRAAGSEVAGGADAGSVLVEVPAVSGAVLPGF